MEKRTPLYEAQKALGAKFITFGGWELPVLYSDILKEHTNVRTNAGLFDVSHMGEILVTGKDALGFVNNLITNELEGVPDNKAVYSPMCYENGTVVDDVIIYKISAKRLLIIVNASNVEKDYKWITSNSSGEVIIENVSEKIIQIALQGPYAHDILSRLSNGIESMNFFTFKEADIFGMRVILSRSGYTGEDGFEIYMDMQDKGADPQKLWNGLLEAGEEYGIMPIGLGARDTLRLEAALPLYGHELSDSITPLEAGLEKFVKFKKSDFIGKKALADQLGNGLKRRLYGFEMLDRGIPRNGYEVVFEGRTAGAVTSGGLLPSLGKNGGLALLDSTSLALGNYIDIVIRDGSYSAKIVQMPFYSKKYKK